MGREFKTTQLNNGLTLIGEISTAIQSAAIGYFVKTGSRDETRKESGVSHFLEHMMFKGTPSRSALEITYALGNIGAQANAFTTEENTAYYASVLKEYFPAMQELLSDMLRPALDPHEFDTEKKVILEEIALYQDKPHFYLFEHATQDYFGDHPAGQSVLGTTESVGALSRDEMEDYRRRRYAANNTVLVASGNFDWEQFVADAEKYCGGWTAAETPRIVRRHSGRALTKTYTKKDLNQAHVVFFSEGPSAQDEERYPLSVLSMILGDSSGSKMYWELIDSGLAESAGADTDERDGAGCVVASASTEPENIDKVSALMREILAAPLDFEDADLARAKTKLAAKVVLGGESALGRLMAMGSEWNYRREVTPLQEVVEKINAISRKDIERALGRFPISTIAEYRLVPG